MLLKTCFISRLTTRIMLVLAMAAISALAKNVSDQSTATRVELHKRDADFWTTILRTGNLVITTTSAISGAILPVVCPATPACAAASTVFVVGIVYGAIQAFYGISGDAGVPRRIADANDNDDDDDYDDDEDDDDDDDNENHVPDAEFDGSASRAYANATIQPAKFEPESPIIAFSIVDSAFKGYDFRRSDPKRLQFSFKHSGYKWNVRYDNDIEKVVVNII